MNTHLYTLLSTETVAPLTWTVHLALNPQHHLYQGHFPGNPVLPGACTLQIIKECTSKLLGTPIQYSQVNSCKFISAINPCHTPEIRLTLTVIPGDASFQLMAEGYAGDICFIKLKATGIKK